ncbi:MAG: hypothetical protein ABR610_11685 [Thermoanaerobaculia bacterium]
MTGAPRHPARAAAALLALAAACRAPADRVRDIRIFAASWAETVRTTAAARAAGQVPRVFARDTFRAAVEELEDARKKLAKLAKKSPEAAEASRAAGRAAAAVRSIAAGSDSSDVSAASAALAADAALLRGGARP